MGALAPLGRRATAHAFGSSANAGRTRALAVLAKGEEPRAFLDQVGDVVEVLLGQTLLQIIRSQRAVQVQRRELDAFRGDLAEQVASTSEAAYVELAEGLWVKSDESYNDKAQHT